jgi:hypothetical protein
MTRAYTEAVRQKENVDRRPKAVYERASEPIWARSRNQVLGFFDGFELLEPGLVPKRLWRSVTGQAGGYVLAKRAAQSRF